MNSLDAMVLAALNAVSPRLPADDLSEFDGHEIDRMRDALRAAMGATRGHLHERLASIFMGVLSDRGLQVVQRGGSQCDADWEYRVVALDSRGDIVESIASYDSREEALEDAANQELASNFNGTDFELGVMRRRKAGPWQDFEPREEKVNDG